MQRPKTGNSLNEQVMNQTPRRVTQTVIQVDQLSESPFTEYVHVDLTDDPLVIPSKSQTSSVDSASSSTEKLPRPDYDSPPFYVYCCARVWSDAVSDAIAETLEPKVLSILNVCTLLANFMKADQEDLQAMDLWGNALQLRDLETEQTRFRCYLVSWKILRERYCGKTCWKRNWF